jgi:5'-deoxynucleotidase YfbR-like HD superfamily hydrolase
MTDEAGRLEKIQQLVLDMAKVERNHRIPGDERRENVVEHSFSVAMLCWELFEMIRPPFRPEKILKYALAHDFLERNQRYDINTYASEAERQTKKEQEANEFAKLNDEFADFPDLLGALKAYETRSDDEALFVWTADKIQHMVLGGMDDWRPYSRYGVTYEQFCKKSEDFLRKGSPYLKTVLDGVIEQSKKTYYDRPKE